MNQKETCTPFIDEDKLKTDEAKMRNRTDTIGCIRGFIPYAESELIQTADIKKHIEQEIENGCITQEDHNQLMREVENFEKDSQENSFFDTQKVYNAVLDFFEHCLVCMKLELISPEQFDQYLKQAIDNAHILLKKSSTTNK
jgi:hypothetical protein